MTHHRPSLPANTDPWMTIAEIAHELRVSKMTVYRLVHIGDLPSTRIGRSFRVRSSAVTTYLQKQETNQS